MATKKAASTKKSTAKKTAAKKQATTKVTTVKAVESRPAAARATQKKLFNLNIGQRPLITALIAEFIGTFILAAAIIASQGQPILVFFALAGIVLAFGALSGAYVNPALTIAAWVTRRMGAWRALGFVAAQVLGAMLALVVLNAYLSNAPAASSAQQLYSGAPELFKAMAIPANKEWLVLMAEILGTAIFGFAVAAATREIKERAAASFTVGLGLYLGLMIAGSAAAFISASAILNPAVAVAVQVNFANTWAIAIYALGSTLGAVAGFALYDLLRSNAKEA